MKQTLYLTTVNTLEKKKNLETHPQVENTNTISIRIKFFIVLVFGLVTKTNILRMEVRRFEILIESIL